MKVLFIRNSCLLISHSQIGYGMGIVATVAHNAGHSVRVIDNNTLYKVYGDKDFIEAIRSFNPDVIAYSMTMHNAYETYQQIKRFKKLFPSIIIIAGGVHMKHCFEEALLNGVEVVVNRDGEKVILPFLEHLEKRGRNEYKNDLESVSGVSFVKEDGRIHFAKEFPSLENLDDVPIVNYSLFNIRDFIKTKNEPGVFYFTGQRGCPFKCTFCSDEIQRADRRMASTDWMLENIRDLHEKYNATYLSIADTNITFPRERVIDLCHKIIESGLNKKISFSCQTSTRFKADEDLVSLMRRSGFSRINFGVERLTPYAQKKINKEQSLEDIHKTLSLLVKYDISPSVFMIAGFPFDTVDLLQEEKKLFMGLTKYTKRLYLSVLCPVPGTVYYDSLPGLKEWYLNKREHLMLRAYFTSVLDMQTFHTIKRNFFDLSEQVQKALTEFYFSFKKINYGSLFTKKTAFLSLCMRIDFLVAKLSQIIFALSPSLESFIFSRLKTIRYYLGSYFFGRNIS